eukprot:CAMPEP_0203749050 /NCGR_PEP_ID=MMETSP0098-20131031/3744_1 /ASSEMBLY_ACC=CAM_ASM_000208 /TAXON_ID=96639 /ORGANISM=" , Strain NY0313808BC1" /LENGTH=109 /DNA_ID=CAMNT_0050637985 /DNA_START=286 /DNA_END=612 /DNA_ORIENTATION=-
MTAFCTTQPACSTHPSPMTTSGPMTAFAPTWQSAPSTTLASTIDADLSIVEKRRRKIAPTPPCPRHINIEPPTILRGTSILFAKLDNRERTLLTHSLLTTTYNDHINDL